MRVAHNRTSQAEAVRRLRLVNGDQFEYSKTVYTGAHSRLTVTCRDHGDFETTYANAVKGGGCSGCRDQKHLDNLIAAFKRAHGDRYDYSRVLWAGPRRRVTIGCTVHAWFDQQASSHRDGSGCARCAADGLRLTADEWIGRFREKFGGTYDYSRVVYRGSGEKVTVGCPFHGFFEVRPDLHLRSVTGCERCGDETRRLEQEDVLARAKAVHRNRYTYPRFEYVTSQTPATVTCPEHGDFQVTPNNHVNGNGCRECSGQGTSSAEQIWMRALSETLGVELEAQYRIPGCPRLSADALLRSSSAPNTVIQYDGWYWHGREGAIERDTRTTAQIRGAGFNVVRLRVDEAGRGVLPDVPGAVNIHVTPLPIRDSIDNVVQVLLRVSEGDAAAGTFRDLAPVRAATSRRTPSPTPASSAPPPAAWPSSATGRGS